MRSGPAAIAFAKAHPSIPYWAISGIDGDSRKIDDLECARSVMAAFDVMPISDMGTATRMWQRTVDKRSGTPLHGAPLYFPNYAPRKSGHVALYDAVSGMAWTTPVWLDDRDAYTTCHLIGIADLARKCGNSYDGWGADIAGVPISFISTAGGSGTTFDDDPMPSMKGKLMTQVLATTLPTPLPAAALATLRSYVGAAGCPLKAGQGLVALVGEAPGTPANVQLTQADKRANEWAADHTGKWDAPDAKYSVGVAARNYEFPEFMALLVAYSAPLSMGGTVAGGGSVDLSPLIAAIRALPAEIDAYSDGRK